MKIRGIEVKTQLGRTYYVVQCPHCQEEISRSKPAALRRDYDHHLAECDANPENGRCDSCSNFVQRFAHEGKTCRFVRAIAPDMRLYYSRRYSIRGYEPSCKCYNKSTYDFVKVITDWAKTQGEITEHKVSGGAGRDGGQTAERGVEGTSKE